MTPMEVAQRLGHSNSIEASRRYAHVWERVNSTHGADFDSLRSAASDQVAQRASQARTGGSNVVPLRPVAGNSATCLERSWWPPGLAT